MNRPSAGAVTALATLAALTLTGCDPSTGLYREMRELTDQKLAENLEYALTRASDLMLESIDARGFSPGQLDDAFVNVVLDYQDSSPPPIPEGRALYDVTISGDQVSFSIFVAEGSVVNSGLSHGEAYAHGCGVLTGTFGTPWMTLTDTDCPSAFTAWAMSNSRDRSPTISLEEIAERHALDAKAHGP